MYFIFFRDPKEMLENAATPVYIDLIPKEVDQYGIYFRFVLQLQVVSFLDHVHYTTHDCGVDSHNPIPGKKVKVDIREQAFNLYEQVVASFEDAKYNVARGHIEMPKDVGYTISNLPGVSRDKEDGTWIIDASQFVENFLPQ